MEEMGADVLLEVNSYDKPNVEPDSDNVKHAVEYVANLSFDDPTAKKFENILKDFFSDVVSQEEFQKIIDSVAEMFGISVSEVVAAFDKIRQHKN